MHEVKLWASILFDLLFYTSTKCATLTVLCVCLFIVNYDIRKALVLVPRLNVSDLIQLVENCFETSVVRKYHCRIYIGIVKDYILPVKSYWGQIGAEEWTRKLLYFYQVPLNNYYYSVALV